MKRTKLSCSLIAAAMLALLFSSITRGSVITTDLITINVSSPNTPDLRALQDELGGLVKAVKAALPRRIPVLVKLSPDEPDERLVEMARAAQDAGADGIIATNTTLARVDRRCSTSR